MKRVTIFGKEGCGFCRRAKELCEIRGIDFRYIDIHQEGISKADLEKTVGKPVETVPQIFCGQDHIGGYTEFAAFVEQALAETETE
ncbi:Glutaredoxin 1 [Marinobacterium lacunae]|uniref:Glutaredoxin 1 n=1 Tax=Marinobacterium lacunae TaxID=1232683 RepID=A0A081FV07_9GAMM|nr:GrxA family glutaredoxin [Marinobacterium lacunae]KEA62362.1 Glutaredoxin 1 [Marinobacterium lacunae]MBR9883725.1 GrxA family glutaredoxin [Oceanospirillales bacterium]